MPVPAPVRSRLLPALAAAVVATGLGLGVAALAGRAGPGPGDVTRSSTTASAAPTDGTGTAPARSPSPGSAAREDASAAHPGDPAVGPRLAFLGDSLTVGVGAPAERGFAWQTAELLGWPLALVDGVSGSGFLAPGGGRAMPDRVPDVVAADPDVVVVAGGTNDVFRGYPPDDVRRAAIELLGELRAGLPEAEVLVLGPLPTSFAAVDAPDPTRDAVRAAAEEVGVTYVDAGALVAAAVHDPAEWDSYISADGLHPNERGYAVLADALAAELGALVG